MILPTVEEAEKAFAEAQTACEAAFRAMDDAWNARDFDAYPAREREYRESQERVKQARLALTAAKAAAS